MNKLFKAGEDMKKIYIISAIALILICASSCKKANELPPINKGYATQVVLPDPVTLTPEDRALIEQQEMEYYDNRNK